MLAGGRSAAKRGLSKCSRFDSHTDEAHQLLTEILTIIHYKNRILDFGVGRYMIVVKNYNIFCITCSNILITNFFLYCPMYVVVNICMFVIYSYINISLYFLRYSLVGGDIELHCNTYHQVIITKSDKSVITIIAL